MRRFLSTREEGVNVRRAVHMFMLPGKAGTYRSPRTAPHRTAPSPRRDGPEAAPPDGVHEENVQPAEPSLPHEVGARALHERGPQRHALLEGGVAPAAGEDEGEDALHSFHVGARKHDRFDSPISYDAVDVLLGLSPTLVGCRQELAFSAPVAQEELLPAIRKLRTLRHVGNARTQISAGNHVPYACVVGIDVPFPSPQRGHAC